MTGHEAVGPNPVTLLFQHVFRARMQTLFSGRSRVADLGEVDLGSQQDLEGAFAAPGALDGADLAAVGRALGAALRPDAPVLLCLGPGRARASGHLSLHEPRSTLGRDLLWHDAFALGVIVPAESRQEWVRRHPQAFGVLAAVEGLVRRWPIVRAAGDYLVLEGARRR